MWAIIFPQPKKMHEKGGYYKEIRGKCTPQNCPQVVKWGLTPFSRAPAGVIVPIPEAAEILEERVVLVYHFITDEGV